MKKIDIFQLLTPKFNHEVIEIFKNLQPRTRVYTKEQIQELQKLIPSSIKITKIKKLSKDKLSIKTEQGELIWEINGDTIHMKI